MSEHADSHHPHVVELQERVAFLERDIETLDGVVRELAGRLDVTVRELTRLREDTAGRLDEVSRTVGEVAGGAESGDPAAASDADLGRELPPHWGRAPGRSGD